MYPNLAAIGNWYGSDLVEITDDFSRINRDGYWFVAGWFEGPILGFRFANWSEHPPTTSRWIGPTDWISDTSETQYIQNVERARNEISQGNVYEVNVCRQLSARWPEPGQDDSFALYRSILDLHPADHASYLRVKSEQLKQFNLPTKIEIISASPESFLNVDAGYIRSTPIKGTAPAAGEFLEKDISENIMIVDLVRNDLSRICEVNSIAVEDFLKRIEIPGISHLVTTVKGRLKPDVGWNEIFKGTFPPGSVTGAPKHTALQLIHELESPRNIYCGTLGVIDSENGTAKLSVAIRTFWKSNGRIHFGTGAGITWGSDAMGEWKETELKANRLVTLASAEVNRVD